jgi:hypothetical protein
MFDSFFCSVTTIIQVNVDCLASVRHAHRISYKKRSRGPFLLLISIPLDLETGVLVHECTQCFEVMIRVF